MTFQKGHQPWNKNKLGYKINRVKLVSNEGRINMRNSAKKYYEEFGTRPSGMKAKQHIDLQNVLVGVMTIGLTYIILVTVTYVFSSAYCGALGV